MSLRGKPASANSVSQSNDLIIKLAKTGNSCSPSFETCITKSTVWMRRFDKGTKQCVIPRTIILIQYCVPLNCNYKKRTSFEIWAEGRMRNMTNNTRWKIWKKRILQIFHIRVQEPRYTPGINSLIKHWWNTAFESGEMEVITNITYRDSNLTFPMYA